MGNKSIATLKQNYEQSISFVPDRYRKGVEVADWQTAAASEAAEKNYAAGVAEAVSLKSRQKGIKQVSNEEWRKMSSEKGAQSIATAMRLSVDKWATNYSPIYDAVISAVAKLPPRSIDALANIDARVKPIVLAEIAASRRQ